MYVIKQMVICMSIINFALDLLGKKPDPLHSVVEKVVDGRAVMLIQVSVEDKEKVKKSFKKRFSDSKTVKSDNFLELVFHGMNKGSFIIEMDKETTKARDLISCIQGINTNWFNIIIFVSDFTVLKGIDLRGIDFHKLSVLFTDNESDNIKSL